MALHHTALFFFILFYEVFPSETAEKLGCFKENKRDRHFKLSPGHYDPQSLTPETCSSVCGAYMAPYAGMTDGRFCFCGSTKPEPTYKAPDGDCTSTCSGDGKKKCGSPDHISVYHTFQPIKKVELKVTGKSIVASGDPVTFGVNAEAGYNIFYQMNYGDGTEGMDRNATGMFTKTYHIPGKHVAKVTASDDSGSVKKTGVAGVTVQAPVNNVTVVCPDFNSYETQACTVTITHGTNLLLHDKVDNKDRTIKIADPVIGVAGCCVPYTAKAQPESLSGDDNAIFIMPAAEFRFHGVVTHWELWADTAGKLTVMVLKPDCDDYCYETNTCGGQCKGTTCSTDKSYCHKAGTCSKDCKETDRYPSGTPLVDYVERQSVELTVSKGHQVVECPYMDIFPGDIIAYKKSTGSATITVSKKETTGDRKYDGTEKRFTKNSGNPVSKTRHHLRAIYSSQTKVSLDYKFQVAKKYTLSVNVSNVDIEGSETATTEIDVQEGINATILAGPKYLAVNTEGIFTILPHTGSSVKRDWDFGDKSTFNATNTDQYKHTYTSKGEYKIKIRCWNSRNTKENASIVTVEEVIVGISVKYVPCITLSNCSFEVTVTGGSNYEITWDFGDLTSNITTEAEYLESHVVNHVYNMGGNLSVAANCSNHVSSKSFSFFLPVQEVCAGLSLIRTGAEKDVPFTIAWTLDHGSDCKFDLTFRGQPIAIEKANATTKRWESARQNGLPANIYPLILKVHNAIGHDEKHVNFTVETAMKGMKSNCSAPLISTGEEASCFVTIEEGSNVRCVWDFDDGTVEHFNQGPQDWALRASTPEVRKHVFTKGKNHNVTITCSNNDRSEPQYHSILVMHGVNDVEFEHENAVLFARPGIGIFTFKAPGADPNDAKVQFSFGDNQFDTKELKMNFNYTHRYRDAGCYRLYVRIWNIVGTKIFNNSQICVIEKIVGLKVLTEPVAAIINQPLVAKVIMEFGPAGSLTNITCNYGDGEGSKSFLRQGKQIDGEDVRSITYKELGEKTITCDIITPLETLTASYKVNVDQEVSTNNCHITTNYPVEHGKKIVYSVVCDKDPMPTNSYITIDRGDGTSEKISFTGTAGVPQTISYLPPKDGHFIAKISLGNGGSSMNVSLPAGSYKRLVGNPGFKCQYKQAVPVNSGYKDGIEGINKNFPTSSPLTCRIQVDEGTPVYYEMTATHESGTPVVVCNQTSSPIICSIKKSGLYTATLKVGNPLGAVSADPKDLQMKEPVQGIHVVDLTPKAKPDEEKTFRISFDSMGDETCINIDFGDDEGETYNYGTEDWCERESSFDDGEFMDEMTNPMEVTRTYYENQNYELKATAVNLFSDARVTFSFSVSDQDCNKPEVDIEDAVTVFTSPMVFEKSKGIVIRGKANITCAASLQNTKSWKIEVIDPDWGSVKKTLDLQSDKAEFVVKAKSLPYGLYKATYSIQMDLSDGTNFVESACSYFKVTKSKLVVVMEAGGISEVDRGENRMVNLSPEKYSYDPDIDRSVDQGFESYTWHCKLMKKVSSKSACESLSKMTTGSISFNSSIFESGEQIQLTCNVTKDSRSAVGKIMINFVTGQPPNLYIEPVGSSRTVQLTDSKMVSSEERLALRVRCKDCEKVKLSCEWTAYSYVVGWPWRDYSDNEVAGRITGMKTETISIKPSMYKLHPDVKKYRFSCKCRQGDGDYGKASLNIDLNPPPQPGSCVISPKNGTIGFDNKSPFNVKCSGWKDETEIVEYKFFCTQKNSKLHQQITTFEEAEDVTIDPPLGADDDQYREHVYVSVKDSMDAAYVYDLGIIQVFPNTANMGDWSDQQKNNALNEIEKVTASGDQKSVTEKLTKLASLLNADKAHNKPGAPGLALTEFQPMGGAGVDISGFAGPSNMGMVNFGNAGAGAPGMGNFGVGGAGAPGMGNFGAGGAGAPGMGNFGAGGAGAPGMGNFGAGGAGAPGMGNFQPGGAGAPGLPGFQMAGAGPPGLPGFQMAGAGAPGLPGLPGSPTGGAAGLPGMGSFGAGGAGAPGMGNFGAGGAGAPGMGNFGAGGAGAPGMGNFGAGGAGAPGMGNFGAGGAGAPGMGNFQPGGAGAPGLPGFQMAGGGAPGLPGFQMAGAGAPGLPGLPGSPTGGAAGLPGMGSFGAGGAGAPGMGQFGAGGGGAPGMGQFGAGGGGAPGMGQFGAGGAGAPGMGNFKLGGSGAPGLPGFQMAGSGIPGLPGLPGVGGGGGSALGNGMVLSAFKTASGVGGLDFVGSPAEREALIHKAEEERDNKAKLRDTIAGACANMTTPDPTAMEQVLTCLHTNAKESAECTKFCQKATMMKTLEITKELSHLNTSSENTKALGTALLNVAQEAAAAAVVNIQWPVLSDKLTAMDTSAFEDYDTDIESNQTGVASSEDPTGQHLLNAHKASQAKIAAEVADMALQTQQLAVQTLGQTLTPGETLEYTTPAASGIIGHLDSEDMMAGVEIQMPGTTTSISFPEGNIFGDSIGINDSAILSAMTTKLDVNTYVDSGINLGEGTQFLNVDLMDGFGNAIEVKDTPEPLKITIARTPKYPKMSFNQTHLKIADWNELYYTQLNITKTASSIHLEIKELEEKDVQIMVILRKGGLPKIRADKCDDVAFIPKSLDYSKKVKARMRYLMDNNKVDNYLGPVWFGFRPMPKGFDSSKVESCADLDKVDVTNDKNYTRMNIGIYTFTSGCYFFDHDLKDWASQGCTVGEGTNYTQTVCYCNHLTTFGSGWAVAPNIIDWNFVFSNADFFKNPTVYVTEIAIAIFYMLAIVWARRKDRKDVEALGVTPLKDNDPGDTYFYEIVTVTGSRKNAGTDSKVFIILSGDNDETDARMLSDDRRKVYTRGGVDSFLMAVHCPLGSLNYVRVWHDNSGKGKFGSWYLKYLVVRDVQTEQKFTFICNRWFAVEEDDGQVDRVVPVAGPSEIAEFGHLFSEKGMKDLADGHLWFSVVTRPPQSRFTRVQRVSCCLCLLAATMLVNAMFYEKHEDKAGTDYTFGPFVLSPKQVYVGLIANLIVFPINFVIVMLFRKSRARRLRPSRVEEALRNVPSRCSTSLSDVKAEVGSESLKGVKLSQVQPSRPGSSCSSLRERSPSSMSQGGHGRKKIELPWFCRYLAWVLLWAVTIASAAIVTFYGISFRDEKVKKWVTSMLVSFITSIFITEPIKVFLTVVIFSLICKKPGDDEDDRPEDEEGSRMEYDEELLHNQVHAYGAARPKKIGYKPPDPTVLQKARRQRLNEIKMWDIIREIVFYSFFLWILMVVSYRNRSPDSFYYKDSLEKMIIKNNDTLQWFSEIHNTEEFWLWAKSGLVGSLRAGNYYNKDPALLLRGFIGDKVSRIMGYATMRQLRVKTGQCSTINVMSSAIVQCNEDYSMFNEDKKAYGARWSPYDLNTLARREYTYTPASELNGYPYWGLLGVYSGGGYVVELRGSKDKLDKAMRTLEKENWIDKYTRAVFVEFTVYNPQVNLFAISTIVAEFPSSGGVLASYRFEPAMLLPYMTSVMYFQVVCEVIYFCFTIAFIIKEARNFTKQRSKYFRSFWNWIELSIITMSIAAIVVYFYRLFVTITLTSEFKKNHGHEYMKFQYVGYWNELFSYMIGWLVFFGSLKFLKLLRFNKRMSVLGSTLESCAQSILHFSLMFWVVFLAFMQLFYQTFMSTSLSFSTFIKAAESGILMMMGKIDIYEMLMVEPILTKVYVFFFVVTVTFILVNMFLSILNDTFGTVRVDIKKKNNDYEIVDFMVNRFKRWVGVNTPPTPPSSSGSSSSSSTKFQTCHTVEEFPDRIDRLLKSINNVYLDGNLEAMIESNGEPMKMAMKQMKAKGDGDVKEDGPTTVHTH